MRLRTGECFTPRDFTIDTDTIPTEDHVKLTPGFQLNQLRQLIIFFWYRVQ